MSDQEKSKKPDVNAEDNSIAVGSISISNGINGNITIGNTTGYTAKQVSILITQIQSTFQPKPFDGHCPYKGLDVFEEEDAELFFGREKLVDDLVSRVKDSRTMFVTGPSGSGKSSLVRAGLLHALKQGKIKGSERWLYATMKPGRDPFESLASVFSRLKSPELGNYFRKNIDQVQIIHECAESALTENKNQRLVLFIDQFEEAFTQIIKEEERVDFLNLITQAATVQNSRLIILFSMRSDFVSNCATYPQLNTLLNQQFVQIGAMQPEELVNAIAQPALRVGLRIDPDLIAQIINEMKSEPGALPLMQFALKDLFDSQQEKNGVIALSLDDYLQRGGIHKALERHADISFSKLSRTEQELARSIFSGLVEIGRGTLDTKRTAMLDELIPANTKVADIEVVIQKLADARLITTGEQAGLDTVTISHEKLIDAWPWLKKLVNENRDVIALQNVISADAKEWEELDHDNSYLYTGARLATAQEKIKNLLLNENSLAYLKAGLAFQNKEQQEREKRLRWTMLALITAAIIFLALGSFGLVKSNEATAQANEAATAQAKAEEQANIAIAQQVASQAKSLFTDKNTEQTTAMLLAIQSVSMFPTSDAIEILYSNKQAELIFSIPFDDTVSLTAFSPDGKYIVAGGRDKIIHVWEVSGRKEIAQMNHNANISSLEFSPDGKYIVSGGGIAIRVWETLTGKEITHMIHNASVSSVAFSPDGKYVVSSGGTSVKIWDSTNGKQISQTFIYNLVQSASFSPNGKYVAFVEGKTTHIMDVQSEEEITSMVHDGTVNSISFSPDSKFVVVGSSDDIVRVWVVATGTEVYSMRHEGSVNSVAFSLNGKYIVSGSSDTTIRVLEATSGQEISRMKHEAKVDIVAFSSDGKYVVSGSWDNTARVWEVETGREVSRMLHKGIVRSVFFSPDGNYIISGGATTSLVWKVFGSEISGFSVDSNFNKIAFSPNEKYMASTSDDKVIRIWDINTGNEITRMEHNALVNSIAYSSTGKYLVSGSDDSTARVWNALTGKQIAFMTHYNPGEVSSDGVEVNTVAFSPDGSYIVSGSNDGTARVWDVTTGKEIARYEHGFGVTTAVFSPDGKHIVSGSDDGKAHVWDAETGKEIARYEHGFGVSKVTSAIFSPDGKYIISGGTYGIAPIWEAATGNEVFRMTHRFSANSIAFSSSGNYVASAGCEKQDINLLCLKSNVLIWDVYQRKEISRIAFEGEVNSIAFSPNEEYLISGSNDGLARVWKVVTGQEVTQTSHGAAVNFVAFSNDGKFAVSGSNNGIARLWIYLPLDLTLEACSRVSRNLTRSEWNQYIGDGLPYQAVCPNWPIEVGAGPTHAPILTP